MFPGSSREGLQTSSHIGALSNLGSRAQQPPSAGTCEGVRMLGRVCEQPQYSHFKESRVGVSPCARRGAASVEWMLGGDPAGPTLGFPAAAAGSAGWFLTVLHPSCIGNEKVLLKAGCGEVKFLRHLACHRWYCYDAYRRYITRVLSFPFIHILS